MEKDFYDTIEEIVQQSGTNFPTWDRNDPRQIGLTTCVVGGKAGNELSITLDGGSVEDPRAAVERIKTYWESQGWNIETLFDNTDRPVPSIQIAATSPTGIEVVVNASTGSSMIRVKSDCSLDPALNIRPTPTNSSDDLF